MIIVLKASSAFIQIRKRVKILEITEMLKRDYVMYF